MNCYKGWNENQLSKVIVDCAMTVHKRLGPGLLESAYEECLTYELSNRGLFVERQKMLAIQYDELVVENAYRMDIVVENKVVIELKAVQQLSELHAAQLLTYLRLSGLKLGLLINFNTTLLKDGLKRVINGTIL